MSKIERLQPKNFSKSIGSYSHGIKLPLPGVDLVFLTGQIAMDEEGNAVAPSNIRLQTEFIFENIKKLLAEVNMNVEHVIKSTIFVTNMDYFEQVSEVRDKYFSKSKPVSTLVEVTRLSKEGCDVEIEVMAVIMKDNF